MKRLFVLCLFIVMSAQASVTNLSATRGRISWESQETNFVVVGDMVFSNGATLGGVRRVTWGGPTNGMTKSEGDIYYPIVTNAQNDMDGIFTIAGAFNATGAVALASTVDVVGAVDLESTFDVAGAMSAASTLAVTGAATMATLDVGGATSVAGTFATSGAVALASTLVVTGDSDFVNLTVSGELDAAEQSDEIYALSYGSLTHVAFTNALANATDKTLVIDGGTWAITDDVTIPSDVVLNIRNGSMISVASGKTLTINGYVDAGLYQIFDGTGSFVLNQMAYPEWWGAVGDDGVCDVLAIQSAVDAADAVQLQAEQYDVDYDNSQNQTALIVLDSDSVFDLGGGIINLLLNESQTNQVILIENATNVVVRNGTLNGDRDIHTGTFGEWGYGICVGGVGGGTPCSDIRIVDCNIDGMRGDGIFLEPDPGTNVFVRGCIVSRARRNALTIESGDGIIISDSVFRDTYGTNPQVGIDIECDHGGNVVKNVLINGCSFLRNARAGLIFEPNSGLIENVNVSGCYFGNNAWSNIPATYIAQIIFGAVATPTETVGLRGVNIVGNSFYSDVSEYTNTTIKVNGNCVGVSILDNSINIATNLNLLISRISGIYVHGSDDVQVGGNRIDNVFHAVDVWDCSGISIYDNKISSLYGISIAANVSDSFIRNNNISIIDHSAGSDFVVNLSSVTNVLISDNMFNGGSYGVKLSSAKSDGVDIRDNKFNKQTNKCIYIYSGEHINMNISDNVVSSDSSRPPYTIFDFREDADGYKNVKIENNYFSKFYSRGMLIQNATNIVVSRNIFALLDVPASASQAMLLSKCQNSISKDNVFLVPDTSYTNLTSYAGYQWSTNIVVQNNVPSFNVMPGFINEYFYFCGNVQYSSPAKIYNTTSSNNVPWYYGDMMFDNTNWFIAKGLTTNDWLQISN